MVDFSITFPSRTHRNITSVEDNKLPARTSIERCPTLLYRGVLFFAQSYSVCRMSCIHLHLGQAGNQIGKSFWGLAEEEFLEHKSVEGGGTFPSTRPSRMPTVPHQRPGGIAMFHEDSWARCLAVDSEPKVRNPACGPRYHYANCLPSFIATPIPS